MYVLPEHHISSNLSIDIKETEIACASDKAIE